MAKKKKKKNSDQEYVIICREMQKDGKAKINVIKEGVNQRLVNNLLALHVRDPVGKRYFLTTKQYFQIYGAMFCRQVEALSVQEGNGKITEISTEEERENA